MDTSRLFPPGREVPTPEDIARLPVTALLLACLDPRFKRLTGWQGFARCPGRAEAWTCRLRSRPGVFGCLAEAGEEKVDGCAADFGLYYFPTPEDPLFERFSLAAEWAVLADDFQAKVRDFAARPELPPLFRLGKATLGLRHQPRTFLFRLEALEFDVLILEAGLRGQGGWVVSPGETEQDLPAWELARELFHVVAGALTFGLGCPPAVAARSSLPGNRRLRLADGAVVREEATNETPLRCEGLAWGDAVTGRESELALPGAPDRTVWLAGDTLPKEAADSPCWQAHDLDAATCAQDTAGSTDRRPALVILTGFLGAGKTSLLLEMVEHHRAHDQFVAIIQNEIGATGVDGYVIDGGETALTLDEGCVCCTLAGSLASGIRRLTERFRPQRIILETSGLANPLNLLHEQEAWADVARLEMVVTVVDAVHGLDMLASSDIARDQVRAGDVLVVNKADLADPAASAALDSRLREFNGRAPLLRTNHGQVHPGLLFDTGSSDFGSEKSRSPSPLLRRRNHVDEAFCAVRLAQPEGLTRMALQRWIEKLPANVFRLKGILRLKDTVEPLVLQGVGRRWEVRPLGHPFEDAPFLVFIGRNLDSEGLEP
jgi:G3E family GTPase